MIGVNKIRYAPNGPLTANYGHKVESNTELHGILIERNLNQFLAGNRLQMDYNPSVVTDHTENLRSSKFFNEENYYNHWLLLISNASLSM